MAKTSGGLRGGITKNGTVNANSVNGAIDRLDSAIADSGATARQYELIKNDEFDDLDNRKEEYNDRFGEKRAGEIISESTNKQIEKIDKTIIDGKDKINEANNKNFAIGYYTDKNRKDLLILKAQLVWYKQNYL